LRDIDSKDCKGLAAVSWVIPDGKWSDHALVTENKGPAWVAAIVNAIGNSSCWGNTAILITWDDWGGWYDHVPPPTNIPTGNQSDYQYGFRVPLLVVSRYTPAGYVNNNVHDFGSILNFIEHVFKLDTLGFADQRSPTDLYDFFTGPPRSFNPISAPCDSKSFLNDRRPPKPPDDDGDDD
jgi:hypothetical protein